MTEVSLVIINDDSGEYLNGLFSSIEEDKLLEIIFIDNFSKDDSIQKARNNGIKNICAFTDKAGSRADLYNKGLSVAKGKYVLFAHSDGYFLDNFFANLLRNIAVWEKMDGFDFANTEQFYADMGNIGAMQIQRTGDTINYYPFCHSGISDSCQYLECSEECFIVKKSTAQEILFNSAYKNSFYEYDFIINIEVNGGHVVKFDDCGFVHYFVELQDKFKTMRQDSVLFEKNNMRYDFSNIYGSTMNLNDFFGLIKDKNIIIFGTGEMGKLLGSILRNVVFYVDNNKDKWEQRCMSRPIYAPSILENINFNESIIIIASIYYAQIAEQLIKMRFKKNKQFVDGRMLYEQYNPKQTRNGKYHLKSN